MVPFDIENVPSASEIKHRVAHYVSRAENLLPRLKAHDESALRETRQLLLNLETEHSEYVRKDFVDGLEDHELLRRYTRWVSDAVMHTSGTLNWVKAHSLAYDIIDYVSFDLKMRLVHRKPQPTA